MKTRARKPLCEHQQRVDVRQLYRSGEIMRGQKRYYFFAGDAVRLTAIPCHFGGSRAAFVCPACEARVFTLYRRGAWACRNCHGLAYINENATLSNRRLNKAFKIRERLGQTEGGIIAAFPKRPKGRWWHTYLRQRRAGRQIEREVWLATASDLGLLDQNARRRDEITQPRRRDQKWFRRPRSITIRLHRCLPVDLAT